MKKTTTVKPFYFKDVSEDEVCDLLNKEDPIKLSNNENLIDRIYKKYPYVSKTDISLVVCKVFESFRELLILGKVLNFNKIFFDTKFHFFKHTRNGDIFPSLKVKITTPRTLGGKFRKHYVRQNS